MANPEERTVEAGRRRGATSWRRRSFGLLTMILSPVAAAMLLYHLDSFDSAPLPIHEFSQRPRLVIPEEKVNPRLLRESEKIGVGKLSGPEDIAYHAGEHAIYTGCADGWIRRITLNDSLVHDWAFTGGRPLGVVLHHGHHLLVADAEKGLLEVTGDGGVKRLTDEAEGVKFKLTDGVDVADDGLIYFTDASYKYNLKEHLFDILEGRPHGRLLSFDPSTNHTTVLARDLFFPNGLSLSPDQNSLIFCETLMKRCLKYHIRGERKGLVDKFIENLPGPPDNIRLDSREGRYWIALAMGKSWAWDMTLKYPWIRKVVAILERYKLRPPLQRNGGVLAVDLEGRPLAYLYDYPLSDISTGLPIRDSLYCGFVTQPYLLRLPLPQISHL